MIHPHEFPAMMQLAATLGAYRTHDGRELVATLTTGRAIRVRRTHEGPIQYTPAAWLRAWAAHHHTWRRITTLTTEVPR